MIRSESAVVWLGNDFVAHGHELTSALLSVGPIRHEAPVVGHQRSLKWIEPYPLVHSHHASGDGQSNHLSHHVAQQRLLTDDGLLARVAEHARI